MEYENISKEQLKDLIELGYNLNLISVEFEIPIKKLQEYKKEIKNEKTQENKKIARMRKNYYKIYNSKNENFFDEEKFIQTLENGLQISQVRP